MTESFSYLEAATAFEPDPAFAHLRSQCPVHHVAEHEPPFFVMSRFGDVVDALRAPDQWRNQHGPGVFFIDKGVLGSADDPDHARHRGVLRRSFTPVAINQHEARLREIADELLDEFVPLGRGDFVDAFAFPFPALAIGELLGVDPADRDMFGQLSSKIVEALTGGDTDAYRAAVAQLGDYIEARVDERELQLDADGDTPPETVLPDDVLTALLLARRAGQLTTGELRHLGHQLLVAGHETTTSLLGLMLLRLIERPELMAELRSDPALIPAAVEEALRFDSPVAGLFRTSAASCTLGDLEVPEHSKMQLLYAAANRDPEQFPEPDTFRLDRPRSEIGKHVAFGWGIHFCIGAPLARLEARIAFERILTRMADISLDGEPTRNKSFVLHGLTSLPIRWTPR